MKVALINCFETTEIREKEIYQYFKDRGHEVHKIKSDFLHMKKEKMNVVSNDAITYLDVIPYQKNLSIRRMYSHYDFAKKVKKYLENTHFDLLYVLVPPNFLVQQLTQYKQAHPEIKVIFDIIDFWPESMPLKSLKNLFPFTMWKNLRNKHVYKADYIVTECDLFKDELKGKVAEDKIQTIYLFRELSQLSQETQLNNDYYTLGYLGSINNIIDIDRISLVIQKLQATKPVKMHIVGHGEKKDEFIAMCKQLGVDVNYHGEVYDPVKKQDIFNQCDFALNIYKETTFIGVTMKSIDYFDMGVPIINSIPGDTARFINQYHCGIDMNDILQGKPLLESKDYRQCMKTLMIQELSKEKGYQQLDDILHNI